MTMPTYYRKMLTDMGFSSDDIRYPSPKSCPNSVVHEMVTETWARQVEEHRYTIVNVLLCEQCGHVELQRPNVYAPTVEELEANFENYSQLREEFLAHVCSEPDPAAPMDYEDVIETSRWYFNNIPRAMTWGIYPPHVAHDEE